MKDTINLLGTILTENPGRDAVHVAVAPVIAIEDLQPGQHIGPDGSPPPLNEIGVSASSPVKTGIVDPFLKAPVKKGERFFMFLYPQTITSLRHEWTHPLFPASGTPTIPVTSESETWLRAFAVMNRIPYEEMIAGITISHDVCFGDDDGPQNVRESYEFWEHVENVTGKRFMERDKERITFRCGC